ncbi:hypothetical protein [Flavobacterium sp.]|uniref:hypothetical protein n=1 Tax=Flavobacterium sp. TaxID=239 RepID=UPI00262E78DE|nr:hypothetical protein [Flavobacterium sp.]
MAPDLINVLNFLRTIGLDVAIKEGAEGFIEGVRIENGCLLVDPACSASSLLHEAGHISCIPGRFRHYMSDDLATGMQRMLNDLQLMCLEPDDPLERAVIQCGDPEATAWAWAAGVAIGLNPDQIIQDHEYGGEGASIRMMLQANQYLGINGLAQAGMCKRGNRIKPDLRYPNLTTWLQSA